MYVTARCPFRIVVIRTPVAPFSHRCRIALLAFAHLAFALLSHSHCWPFRTVGIRTVGFALVSFALLSFALLSYKRLEEGETERQREQREKERYRSFHLPTAVSIPGKTCGAAVGTIGRDGGNWLCEEWHSRVTGLDVEHRKDTAVSPEEIWRRGKLQYCLTLRIRNGEGSGHHWKWLKFEKSIFN